MSEKSLEKLLPKSKGDAACMHILSHRSVLARILAGCVPEFEGCSLEDIENKYIEGDILVSEDSVHRGESTPMINGLNNEDSTVDEGVVKYDIKFTAIKSHTNESIGLILNIEAQDSYNPGYSLVRRAMYYCSRLLSTQYGTVFSHSDYDKIKKVYSIWICTNPRKEARNSVSTFKMEHTRNLGNMPVSRDEYDLLTVIMICLGDLCNKDDISQSDCYPLQTEVLQFLSTLFTLELTKVNRVLRNDFNFHLKGKLKGDVNTMCNVSDGWERIGLEKGMKKGIEQGIVTTLYNAMKNGNMSLEQAMQLLGIPIEQKDLYANLISEMSNKQ